MNTMPSDPDDRRLSERLRAARPSAALPPRFQDNVWRRIERAEANNRTRGFAQWIESLAALVVRPRIALTMITALVLAGAMLGMIQGARENHRDAQARYVAAVAPNPLR